MQLDLSKVVAIDFETYYDKDYSLRLKTMNTSEYIRDDRFLAHCVSIKRGEAPTEVFWYSDIRPAIERIFRGECYLLAHNVAFDGAILAEHYHVCPSLYLDTLSMARALHAGMTRASLQALCEFYGLPGKNPNILGKMKGFREIPQELREEAALYCVGDTDKCFQIFKRMIEVYPEDEIALVDWTVRQFCDPVLHVDVDRAQAELEREIARKKELIDKTGLDEEQLQSANKFAQQLRDLGVDPPMKMSARTKMLTFAFSQQDDEFMALASHEDQKVRELLAARLAAKSTIGETRAERFVKVGTRPLPVGLNYCAAHTTRWGGTNKMNLQNLPKEERDEQGNPIPLTGELRKSIVAPEGHVIVVADSAQIEPRILAWFAGQNDLLELFRAGEDPYCAMGPMVYGREITKRDRDERAVLKAATLGLGYYMSAKRFQGTLAMGILGPKIDMPLDFCERVVRAYRAKNHMITAAWRDMGMILYRMLMKKAHGDSDEYTTYKVLEYDAQSIWLPNGLGLHYPDLQAEWNDRFERFEDFTYRSNAEYVRVHPGILIENVIQALARVVIGEQLLKINAKYRAVMTTHDEIVCIAEDHEADECLAFMIEQMSTPPHWAPDLPLGAEGGFDRCYSK